MPRERIHTGDHYGLRPMKVADNSIDRPGATDYVWYPGYLDADLAPEGFIHDLKPDLFVSWYKARDIPGDAGYVHLEVAVTPAMVRRQLEGYDAWATNPAATEPVPERIIFEIGALSWRELNNLEKIIAKAKNDAHGEPR